MHSQPSVYPASLAVAPPLRRAAPFFLLVFVWGVSGIGTTLADSVLIKAALLVTPLLISLLVTLVNPNDGFAIWVTGIGFLITQTGYQFDAGAVRLSALEVLIVALLPILLWSRRSGALDVVDLRIPGQLFLLAFAIDAWAMLLLGLHGGAAIELALFQFKGFLIYPLMIYIIVAGVRDHAQLRWSVGLVVAWFVYVAGRGIWKFLTVGAQEHWDAVVRVEGDYAAINTYGVTLVAIALLVIGVAISAPRRRVRLGLLLIGCWLFLGALAAGSRTVWVAFGSSLAFLLLFGNTRKLYPLGLLVLAALVLLALPESITGRILQLSDSSTLRRTFYLDSGLAAWKAQWLSGWGWGRAFWLAPDGGLAPTNAIPWYHNDYLNLAVQTGAIGLLLYLLFWQAVVRAAQRWLASNPAPQLAGYVRGCLAALIGLLVAAAFEHVLWRPDIAGLIGWLAGLLLATIALAGRDHNAHEGR